MRSNLEVISVSEDRTDKNGRTFRLVALRAPKFTFEVDEITSEIVPILTVNQKVVKVNAYKQNYLNDTMDTLYDVPEGTRVLGRLETRRVEEYTVGERKVEKRTLPVFEDPNSPGYELAVEAAFKNADHKIIPNIPHNKLVQTAISKGQFDVTTAAVKPQAENFDMVPEETEAVEVMVDEETF